MTSPSIDITAAQKEALRLTAVFEKIGVGLVRESNRNAFKVNAQILGSFYRFLTSDQITDLDVRVVSLEKTIEVFSQRISKHTSDQNSWRAYYEEPYGKKLEGSSNKNPADWADVMVALAQQGIDVMAQIDIEQQSAPTSEQPKSGMKA